MHRTTAPLALQSACRVLLPRAKKASTMATDETSPTVSIGDEKVSLQSALLVAIGGARVDLHAATLDKACSSSRGALESNDADIYDVRCTAYILDAVSHVA